MLKIIGNRTFATVLVAVIIVCSILSGASRTLGNLRAEAEGPYYGADADGMGIEYDLTVMSQNAQNLLTVAGRYIDAGDPLCAELRDSRTALLGTGPQARNEKCRIADGLVLKAQFLADALYEQELTDRDRNYVTECRANILSAQNTIAHNGYNRAAAEFNVVLSRSPAGLLGWLTGVTELELFE